ncbi:alpha/beta fold hydrolase [Candidatus Pseudoscillospira sp. SGI.172]|uniref:alpha/beta fold hydrolase n=1 Tax=Candidatus Pseudoscillospira sp. SGI.172 TaxID=3420582 RepID=UPI003D08C70B
MKQKKLLSLVLSLAMMFSLAAPALAAEETAPVETVTPYTVPADVKDKLVILHTNDTHGHDVAVEGETVGTAGVAALKKDFEAAGATVLLLSAGDFSQGTTLVSLDKGASAVDFMNAAGYNAASLGNHEFDYKIDALKANVEKAGFPVLAANIVVTSTGKPLFGDRVTFDTAIGKVGVFGLDTPETMTKAHPDNVKGLTFYQGEELIKCAQAQVDALKADGCAYIVALSHLGVDPESEPNRSTDVFAKVTGVDLVVDGHSHTEMEGDTAKTVGDALVVSTGEQLNNVGVVITDGTDTKSELVSAAAYTKVDTDVAKIVNDRDAEVSVELNRVFATTEVKLDGNRAPGVRTQETNLGDFAADAILWSARQALGEDKVDVALTNGGGIRATIEAGDITMNTMKTVFPFGNEVATIDLTGAELLEALEAATCSTPTAIGAFPQVAGMSFQIDTSVAYANGAQYPDSTYFAPANPGSRVTDVTVNGEALDLEATYTLATNDFTAAGGDTYGVFLGKSVYKTGVALEDALVNYTREVLGNKITAADYGAPAGRITVKYVGVDGSAWYAQAAKFVMDAGMMSSTGNGFDPDAVVTRATVFQMLYNDQGKPAMADKASFSDVEGKWYADSAAWAESVGLAQGDNGSYAGDRAVTRAELAVILTRYAAAQNMVGAVGDYSAFADAADVASWASEGISFAVGSGVISGKPGNLLDPNGTAVRSELATVMMNYYTKLTAPYEETVVAIDVPATDGVPAHTVPGILTVPAGDGKYPAVVMLHGTGSNKNEAGGGYDMAAPAMALSGIASLRIDFMGNGDSTADYINYSYTSANVDAKAAADYLAALDSVDGGKLAVMGWSQGGTNALLAAAKYPQTFKAVITWSGAVRLDDSTGLFGDKTFAQAKAIADKDGSYEMTFDWRDPLQVGKKWFADVASTDVLKETAKIAGPVLAINGDQDTTVTPDNAAAIAEAAKDGRVWMVKGADHTYNVFTGDYSAIGETINVGIGFLEETFNGALEPGSALSVSKYGNVTTTLPVSLFDGAGYEVGDVLSVTVGDTTLEAPYGTAYSNVDNGSVIILPDSSTGTMAIAINMGNFAKTYSVTDETPITFSLKEKAGYLEEYQIRNIDTLRTNDRADYSSDEVFANFRGIVMGNIPEGTLYRSSSPVNPELGRNTYADALAKAAGVKTIIDLADSEEERAGYEGFAQSYASTVDAVALNMGVDFAAEDFNAKLKTGLEYMIAHEGPYLIHCNEGKDRAGFVSALLSALGGGSADQIVEDYMLSYENYYHVEHHSDRWYRIANSNIIKTLCTLTGTTTEAEMKKADLQKAAETYLTEKVGLSAEQVTALLETITTQRAAAQPAA